MIRLLTTAAVLGGMLLVLPAGAGPGADRSPIVSQEVDAKLKAPITLKAQNSPLPEVLAILAERSGLNFVTGNGVEREEITIVLNDTPLDEAINLVVRAAGLSYEIIGNSILVAAPDKLQKEVGQSGYVVALRYADATEVAAMLSDLTENIMVDRGGNRLVCYTSPRIIIEIEKIVRAIDHPHTQIVLETRILEVTVDDLFKYGFDWSSLFPVENAITHPEFSISGGLSYDFWKMAEVKFGITLDMLLQDGNARILMDSRLSTMNNREAKLHIGDIVPYTIQAYNATAGGGASMEIEKEEVGVKISMTPHINDDGEIILTLEPEVSTITGWKGANADLPLVRVRKTSTTVRVNDGQLVSLAGLLAEEKTETIQRFPVLGHIPYLGRLFQHRREENKSTNLIIEVRPRIVKSWDDASWRMKDTGEEK